MDIGTNIRKIRKSKGLTQIDVARMAKIAVNSLRLYEAGKRTPKYDTLKHIAAALGVEWLELVPEGQQAQTIIEHIKEGLKDEKPFTKMADAELYRRGYLKFHSEKDRIAYFYSRLNTDGKLAAGACFFQYLDKDKLSEVADYVMNLSENPLCQIAEVEPSSSDGEQSE